MKSQENMNQLSQKIHYRQIGKEGIRYTEEVESSKKVAQKNQRPTCINVVRQVIHQTNVGAMGKKNSMKIGTIAISMVIEVMNAKRNLNLKSNVTKILEAWA